MAKPLKDIQKNAPTTSRWALILVDVINDLEWSGGQKLLKPALQAARSLLRLKQRARKAGVPVLYVNDNFGKWQSDIWDQVRHCVEDNTRGKEIVELLCPDEMDYCVLKPRHSGFFASPLEILLDHMHVEKLVIAGFTTESCILLTVADAYLRNYEIIIPSDAVASCHPKRQKLALEQMTATFGAKVKLSRSISFRS